MTHVSQLFDLSGKVALVTGASQGLGYHAAEALAESGAELAICGRKSDTVEAAARRLQTATGRSCLGLRCDIANEADVNAMVAQVIEHYGRCDILINNAGIGGMQPTESCSLAQWQQMMAINLDGMFLCSREIGKLMLAQKSGVIINFSSENGQVGFSSGMAAYATTKIGAIGLTRSLAVEWGKYNVRVNALLPGNMAEGMMATLQDASSPFYQSAGEKMLAMTPLNDFGNADDIKGAVAYLASDAARYVTGAALVVDGGFTINSGL